MCVKIVRIRNTDLQGREIFSEYGPIVTGIVLQQNINILFDAYPVMQKSGVSGKFSPQNWQFDFETKKVLKTFFKLATGWNIFFDFLRLKMKIN